MLREWEPQRQRSKAVEALKHEGARLRPAAYGLMVDASHRDGNCGRRRAVAPYAMIAAINPPMPSSCITRFKL